MKVVIEIEVESFVQPKDVKDWVNELDYFISAPGVISTEIVNYDWFHGSKGELV